MLKMQFDAEIERLTEVYDDLKDGVVRELERAYIGLDERLWKRICTWVIDNSKFTPKPAKFKDAHAALIGQWRAERVQDEKPKFCPECQEGKGFLVIYYTAKIGGHVLPYQGVRPCRTCNPNQRIPKGKVAKENISYITKQEYENIVGAIKPPDPPRFKPDPDFGNVLTRVTPEVLTSDQAKQKAREEYKHKTGEDFPEAKPVADYPF